MTARSNPTRASAWRVLTPPRPRLSKYMVLSRPAIRSIFTLPTGVKPEQAWERRQETNASCKHRAFMSVALVFSTTSVVDADLTTWLWQSESEVTDHDRMKLLHMRNNITRNSLSQFINAREIAFPKCRCWHLCRLPRSLLLKDSCLIIHQISNFKNMSYSDAVRATTKTLYRGLSEFVSR